MYTRPTVIVTVLRLLAQQLDKTWRAGWRKLIRWKPACSTEGKRERERDLCMTGNITTTCSFCSTNIISKGHRRGLVLSTVGHYWSRIWWLLVAIVVPSVSAHKETKVNSDVSQDRITATGWLTSRLDEDCCLTNLLSKRKRIFFFFFWMTRNSLKPDAYTVPLNKH